MWPFEPNYSEQVRVLAPLLDTVFMEFVGKLKQNHGTAFMLELRKGSNVEAVDEHGVPSSMISWQDIRLPGFTFWVNFSAHSWSFHASGVGVRSPPSFVGIMLTAGPGLGSSQSISKAVSVENYIRAKATSAAKALRDVLSSTYGHRDLQT